MSENGEGLQEGDEVVFVDVYHAMNSTLKSYGGSRGTVQATPEPESYNDKVLVEFHEQSPEDKKIRPTWWINPIRLEKVGDGDHDE